MLTTTPTTKVGDLLYYKSIMGGWKAAKIMSETKTHWLVGTAETKVNKKTMLEGRKRKGKPQPRWYTKEQKDDLEFCWRWNHVIANAVGRCDDAHALVQVASLLGVELK